MMNEWWMNRHTYNKSLAPMPVPSIDPIVTVKKGKCCINKKRQNLWKMYEWWAKEWINEYGLLMDEQINKHAIRV